MKHKYFDETLDSSENLDINGMEKVEDSIDKNSLADLNDLNDLKETITDWKATKFNIQSAKRTWIRKMT